MGTNREEDGLPIGYKAEYEQTDYTMPVGGVYGTCDWGGCDNPANATRDGLPICDDCLGVVKYGPSPVVDQYTAYMANDRYLANVKLVGRYFHFPTCCCEG